MENRKKRVLAALLLIAAAFLVVLSILLISIMPKEKQSAGKAVNYTLVENSDGTVTANPVITEEALVNPGMGWILIDTALEKYIDAGTSGDYPLVGNVSIMATWGELEPEEGKYHWELVDKAINAWVAKGKEIKFRISTDDFPYYDKTARGVPDWVIDLGVPVKSDYYQEHYLRYPDANNPVYQQKLKNFMSAFVKKYGDNPHLKIVDLRGYGLWGEWHSGYVYDNLEDRRTALKSIIDIWYDAWNGKKPLALNYSHEWRSLAKNTVKPAAYEDYLKYSAFDYALTKENIHWEREGFYGAMEPNEWKLNEETFKTGKIQIAEIAAGYSDLALKQINEGVDHHEKALEECLRARPNYITIFGWDKQGSANEFYENRADLIEKGLKNMGYRFVIGEVTYKPVILKTTDFKVEFKVKNLAVGRCHENAKVKISLWDKAGKEIAYSISDVRLFDALKETDISGSVEIKLTGDLKGRYVLKASIVDDKLVNIIKMPLKGRDDKGFCEIGQINIK